MFVNSLKGLVGFHYRSTQSTKSLITFEKLYYTLRQATVKDIEILDRIHTQNMNGYFTRLNYRTIATE